MHDLPLIKTNRVLVAGHLNAGILNVIEFLHAHYFGFNPNLRGSQYFERNYPVQSTGEWSNLVPLFGCRLGGML